MIDLQEFNNRKYDAYVWVKVRLPLHHLARPIFEAVRNSNMKEIEALIPSLEVVDSEIIGFAYRDDIDRWDEFKKGDSVFDPSNPKKKLFDVKKDNKACPISQLRSSENDWKELVERICGAKIV